MVTPIYNEDLGTRANDFGSISFPQRKAEGVAAIWVYVARPEVFCGHVPNSDNVSMTNLK